MLFQLMGDFESAYKAGLRQLLGSENLWPFILGQQQNRVIDLITQDENMPEFISFLFLEEIRLPYITSELFQTENERIMKCLFGQADDDSGTENPMDDSPIQKSLHIKTLLKFARQDYLLVTQAGYIAKAMFAIIRKRGHELWELISGDFLSDLLKHIWIKHIAEIVEKLILLDNDDDHEKNIIERQTLLRRVFAILVKRWYDKDIVYNICDLIIEVRKGSNQYLIDETQLYYEDLVASAHKSMNENFVLLLSTYDAKQFQMEDIVFALKQEDVDLQPFMNSQGKLTYPLGLYKQYWINIAVKIFEKPELHQWFDHHIFKQVLILMNKFPYNAQLHIQFEKIVTISLDYEELLEKLLKTKYIEFIMENNNPQSDHGYRTILNNLSVLINNNTINKEGLVWQYLTLNDLEFYWNNYFEAIQDRIQTEKQFLLGYNPRAPVLDAPKFKPELKFLSNFSLKQQQMKVEKRIEMLQKNNQQQSSNISIRKVNSANENDANNEFSQRELEPEPEPEPEQDEYQFGGQHQTEDEPYPHNAKFNYSTYWKLDHSSDFEQKVLDQYE